MAGYIPTWYDHPKTVTHPSTKRARRRVTWLIHLTPLPLCQTVTRRIWRPLFQESSGSAKDEKFSSVDDSTSSTFPFFDTVALLTEIRASGLRRPASVIHKVLFQGSNPSNQEQLSEKEADGTHMSVLLIVGPKCTLAALHACPMMSHGEYADGTNRQTDRGTDARSLHYSFR